jgi:hypothetical protein
MKKWIRENVLQQKLHAVFGRKKGMQEKRRIMHKKGKRNAENKRIILHKPHRLLKAGNSLCV